jgi:hypothetical protein
MATNIEFLSGVSDNARNFSVMHEQLSSINFSGSFGKTITTKKVKNLEPGEVIISSDPGIANSNEIYLVSFLDEDTIEDGSTIYYIYYLDQGTADQKKYTVGSSESDFRYTGEEDITVEVEDPLKVDPGSAGWAISKYGNAVFSNVYVRGEIEATSGEISGSLSIGQQGQSNIILGSGDFLDSDNLTYYGLLINQNNYLLSYKKETVPFSISQIQVIDTDTIDSSTSLVTLNLDNSSGIFTGVGSEFLELYGFQGSLSFLNNSWGIAEVTSSSVKINVPRVLAGSHTSFTVQPQAKPLVLNNRLNITSVSIANSPVVSVYSAIFTAVGHNYEEGTNIVVSGITNAAILGLNSVFSVASVSGNTFKAINVSGNVGTYTTGISSALVDNVLAFEDETKFRAGSADNFMSYSSELDKLIVTGEIVADSGNFAGALTVNNGTMKFGKGVTTGKDGLRIDANNFWYSTGEFNVGGSGGISYSGTGNVNIGGGVTVGGDISTATGTITGQTFRTSSTATTNGVIFDSAGVRGYNSSVKKFDLTSSGILTVTGANVTGAINATSGYIGGESSGWQITTDTISSVGGTNKVYLINGSNPKISISSNSASKGSFIAGDTPFYVDGDGRLSLGTQMYFDPNDTQSFGKLTVIGRISGAIDNVTTVPTDSNTFSVSQAVISGTNQAVLTTTATHSFTAGDTVVIASLTGNAAVANGAFVVLSSPAPTSTTFAVTVSSGTNGTVSGQTGTAKIREMTLGLHAALSGSPAGYGIRLDENNYWFVNNQFKVGTSGSYFSWDGATLEVKGKVTSTDGDIGAWTLSNEELYSDISDTGNTYRTGIKAATGIGGGTYTPSVFYMVHDHNNANTEPEWSESHTPFYADSNGRFSLADRFFFDQDVNGALSQTNLTIYSDGGRIGGTAADDRGWSFGNGLLYSGNGTSFVSLATPGALPDTSLAKNMTVTKMTVDSEGDGYSSIYIELYLADMITLLTSKTSYTSTQLLDQATYSQALAEVFSNAQIKFSNGEGATTTPLKNIFDTALNTSLTDLANRFLIVRNVYSNATSLSGSFNNRANILDGSSYISSDKKINLVIYGEDYGLGATVIDEQVVAGSNGYPSDSIAQVYLSSDNLQNNEYVFWAGNPLATEAPTYIKNTGDIKARDIIADHTISTSMSLAGHQVFISATNPAAEAVAGDIWIDIS